MDIRDQIIDEAKSWLLTPWRHMGEVKGSGVDCAQFPKNVYANVGLIEWFKTEYYPPDWMMHREEERFLAYVESYAHKVDKPQKGDMAIFKIGRCFSHGSIILQWPSIIHAFLPERCVVYGDGTQGLLRGKDVKFYSVIK